MVKIISKILLFLKRILLDEANDNFGWAGDMEVVGNGPMGYGYKVALVAATSPRFWSEYLESRAVLLMLCERCLGIACGEMKSFLRRVEEIFIRPFNEDLRSLSAWEAEGGNRAAESHVSAVSK